MADTYHGFSWDQLSLIVGVIPIHGYSDGNVISIVYDNEMFTGKNGVDGEFSRVGNRQLAATISITLLQGTSANDALSTLLLADLATNIPFPVFLKDNSGRTIGECPECYVKKFPDMGLGRDVQDRSWEIQASAWVEFVGGN